MARFVEEARAAAELRSPHVVQILAQGVMETEEPLQMECNKLLRRIQDAMHLFSVAKVIAPKDAHLNPDKLRNVSGDLVEYEGSVPPKVSMPNSASSEVYKFLSTLRGWIFESQGVSQMSASSIKPPGIESGRALNMMAETETGRHALLSTAWENFFMDIADLTVEACKDIGGHVSRYRTKCGYDEIKWSEIDLDRTSYELKVFPTSYLPITPTGRLDTVERLMDAQLLEGGVPEARKLLAFPDLEQSDSLATAAIDDVDRQIELMLDGEAQSPEPFMVMQQGIIDRVAAAQFRAKTMGCDQAELDLMQAWIEQAQAMLEEEVAKRQEQMEVMQAAAEMPPGADAAPPPDAGGMPPELPPEAMLPEPELPV